MGAIQNAAAEGDIKRVLSLLSQGINVNDPGDSDRYGTPLHHAAYGGYVDIMNVLIERGAKINAVDSLGNTPLALAVQAKKEKAVDFLLQHGADANIPTMSGETAFHDAVLGGNEQIVSLILSHGGKADIKGKNIRGEIVPSPREYADEYGSDEMKKLFCKGVISVQKSWWQFWK